MGYNLHFFNQRSLLKKLRQVSLAYKKLKTQGKSNESTEGLKRSIIQLVTKLKNIASLKQIKTAMGSLALVFLCSPNLSAQDFKTPEPLAQVSVRGFVLPELVDWDNDGDLDVTGLVIGDTYEDATSFYLENIGSATEFELGDIDTSTIQFPTIQNTIFTESGDLDGDGDVDLVRMTLGYYAGNSSIYFHANEGGVIDEDQTLNLNLESENAVFLADASLVDFDNDGDLDIFSVGLDYEEYDTSDTILMNLYYFENIGDGTIAGLEFEQAVVNPNGFKPTNLGDSYYFFQNEMADFDNDGDIDIVFSALDYDNPNLLYAENIDGEFAEAVNIPVLEDSQGYQLLSIGDVDGDGDIDIIYDEYSDDDYGTQVELFWLENTTIVSSVSSEKQIEGQFKILGNVSNDFITLEYQFEKDYASTRFDIVNMLGQTVYSETINNSEAGQIKIDVTTLSSGAYHLMLSADEKIKSLKFIVD